MKYPLISCFKQLSMSHTARRKSFVPWRSFDISSLVWASRLQPTDHPGLRKTLAYTSYTVLPSSGTTRIELNSRAGIKDAILNRTELLHSVVNNWLAIELLYNAIVTTDGMVCEWHVTSWKCFARTCNSVLSLACALLTKQWKKKNRLQVTRKCCSKNHTWILTLNSYSSFLLPLPLFLLSFFISCFLFRRVRNCKLQSMHS
jgi:hypothetical protein